MCLWADTDYSPCALCPPDPPPGVSIGLFSLQAVECLRLFTANRANKLSSPLSTARAPVVQRPAAGDCERPGYQDNAHNLHVYQVVLTCAVLSTEGTGLSCGFSDLEERSGAARARLGFRAPRWRSAMTAALPPL